MNDIDIVNCFPTVLFQIYERHGIAAPLLRAYVDQREQIIEQILADNPTFVRLDLKLAYIVALHNGDYAKHATGARITMLDQFREEQKTAALALACTPEHKPLYELAKNRKDKSNPSVPSLAGYASEPK